MFFQVNFPVECFEDIFHHLSRPDLLKCTSVCPEWNEIIGSTRSCMNKIKFRLFRHELKSVMLNSDRKYECIELGVEYTAEVKELLMAKSRRWTHFYTPFYQIFDGLKQFRDFLRIFQFSVQKINLSYGEISETNNIVSDLRSISLQFP